MTIEKELYKLKNYYQMIQAPPKLEKNGWKMLEKQLVKQSSNKFHFGLKPLFVGLTALLFFVTTSLFVAQQAQGALPGEPLYPVKRLSENIIQTVTNDPQVSVDNRAREIVDLSKKQKDKHLKNTMEEYKKAVEQAKQKAEKSEKEKESLRKKLEKQEKEFQKAHKDSLQKETIDEAIKAAKKGKNGKDKENKKTEKEESDKNQEKK